MSGMRWDSAPQNLEAVAARSLGRVFPGSSAVATQGFGPTTKAWVARYRLNQTSGTESVIVKWFSERRADAYARERSLLGAIGELHVGPQLLGNEDGDLLLVMQDLGDETDPAALAEALAALHECTRSGDWPVSRLPSRESIVDAIARNLTELGVSPDSVIREFEGAAAVLDASPQSLIHGDVLPSNARRSPLGPRLIDFEDASAGPSIIDSVAPLVYFPTAARAVDWSAEDVASFESTYRSRSQSWYQPWTAEVSYARDRAAGLAYWVGRALGTSLTGPAAAGELTNHRPLHAAEALSAAYPQMAQAADIVRGDLLGSGPPA